MTRPHFKRGPVVKAVPCVATFNYVNWKLQDHRYVIIIESIEYGPYHEGGTHSGEDRRWVMHGSIVTRDGDPRRRDLGANRRRTFLLEKIRDLETRSLEDSRVRGRGSGSSEGDSRPGQDRPQEELRGRADSAGHQTSDRAGAGRPSHGGASERDGD